MNFGSQLPQIKTKTNLVTSAWIERLGLVECPAITAKKTRKSTSFKGKNPIVWAEAQGSNVRDVEGNIYIDLSSGFAVAGVGHRHPKVVEAAKNQLDRLMHAMGDLFPAREKIELLELIAQKTPGSLQQSILATSGSDAVEAAIKTALIATKKRRIFGFHAGYHGLTFGSLGVTGYRNSFRQPFNGFAGSTELRLPFPSCHNCPMNQKLENCDFACLKYTKQMLTSEVSGSEDIAAIIIEPIQGRGGDIVPPSGWLTKLREWTKKEKILLIFDEIYTGFGRTGQWFACEDENIVPDIMTIGKGMGGGFPIGAAIATEEVMNAWGESLGESIHTSTFLGNPLGAAVAIATIKVLEEEELIERSKTMGNYIKSRLLRALGSHKRVGRISGRGMMLGVALLDQEGNPWELGAVKAMEELLERGIITVPSGHLGDVISLSPPFVISKKQIDFALDLLIEWILAL